MATAAPKLPRTLENLVAAQVKQGVHRSREAAIVAAVAREKQRAEQRASLIAEIQKGLDCGTAGPLGIDEVFCRGRRRIAPRERPRRTYKTGRNQQINFKATAATIERFYRIADEKKLPLCETLELALDALGQLPR